MTSSRHVWKGWTPTDRAVLVLIRDLEQRQILLIHKKRGLGAGKINFPGGRLEPGEGWLAAARRETREEVGLDIVQPRLCAIHRFQFTDGYGLLVRAYTVSRWGGQERSSPEAEPFWCPETEIPYARMWADDGLWVPRVLEGFRVRARWLFDGERMLGSRLEWDHP